MPAQNPRPAVKDEVYYWDTVRFLVDGTIFKLPRYRFVVGSEFFYKTYLQGTPASCTTPPLEEGDDDWDSMDVTDAPRLTVSTAGAVELEGVSAEDFRVFLKLLFPIHSITTTITFTKAEWLTILALSTRWHFLEFRMLAISHLSPQMSDPIEMITVGRRECVEKWVEGGYEKLVLKQGAISEEESWEIGWKTAVRLYIVRHELERGEVSVKTEEANECAIRDARRDGLAIDRIRARFRDELRVLETEENSRRLMDESHGARSDEDVQAKAEGNPRRLMDEAHGTRSDEGAQAKAEGNSRRLKDEALAARSDGNAEAKAEEAARKNMEERMKKKAKKKALKAARAAVAANWEAAVEKSPGVSSWHSSRQTSTGESLLDWNALPGSSIGESPIGECDGFNESRHTRHLTEEGALESESTLPGVPCDEAD